MFGGFPDNQQTQGQQATSNPFGYSPVSLQDDDSQAKQSNPKKLNFNQQQKNSGSSSLFDEDDIVGAINSNTDIFQQQQQSQQQQTQAYFDSFSNLGGNANNNSQPFGQQQQSSQFSLLSQMQGINFNNTNTNTNEEVKTNNNSMNNVQNNPFNRPPQQKQDFTISENHYGGEESKATSYSYSQNERAIAMQNMSSGHEKTFFQTYIFDHYKYAYFFNTNTKEVFERLQDAMWPFFPQNQHHLVKPDGSRQAKPPAPTTEIYGPLWILITLMIELVMFSHIQHLILIEMDSEGVEARKILKQATSGVFTSVFDPSQENANSSLLKILRLFFALVAFMFLGPFVEYLTYKGADSTAQVSYLRLFQITGYSFAIYVPMSFLYIMASPFKRIQLLILGACAGIHLYYTYKESIGYANRYLSLNTQKIMAWFHVGLILFFSLLYKYYFIA